MSRTTALHLDGDASPRRRALRAAFTALLGLVVIAAVAGQSSARATTQGPDLAATQITSAPGDEWVTGISGDWMVYQQEIEDAGGYTTSIQTRYLNLSTQASGVIPQPAGNFYDLLADIDGTNVVFSRYFSVAGTTTSAIYLFDIQAGGQPVELAPVANSAREIPAIGAGTVAWVDWGTYPLPDATPSLVVYDVAAQQTTTLATGAYSLRAPSVSPDGQYVVWTRCAASVLLNCDVMQASRTGGAWTVTALAADPDLEESEARVSDSRVVYTVTPTADRNYIDLAWRPIGGGAETRLGMPGQVSAPDTDGRLVVFGHRNIPPVSGEGTTIWVYDTATDTLRRATDGTTDDSLPRVGIAADGTAHVAWARVVTTAWWATDVYGVSFPIAPVAADPGLAELIDDIEDLGLPQGLTNSLVAKLNAATVALEAGDTATACTRLADFSNEVQAQSGKKISSAAAAVLLQDAAEIRTSLGCA